MDRSDLVDIFADAELGLLRTIQQQDDYYRISQEQLDNLPEGLAHFRDGGIGDIPEGHITIYPTVPMSFSRFTKLIKSLDWMPVN
jgi:hypothetical protein